MPTFIKTCLSSIYKGFIIGAAAAVAFFLMIFVGIPLLFLMFLKLVPFLLILGLALGMWVISRLMSRK